MSTNMRPELSEKNKYWIDRHRYYELKHFCMQYPNWKTAYRRLDATPGQNAIASSVPMGSTHEFGDPTAKLGTGRAYYSSRIELLERVARMADDVLGQYLLVGIVNGWSYDILNARFNIPCSKDTYYDRYRKFFWLLDKERG